MGLFNWFRTKTEEERKVRHVFTDEDREFSKQITQAKRELELAKISREDSLHKLKMEKEKIQLDLEIEELKQQYSDLTEDEPDTQENDTDYVKMFLPLLLAGINKPTSTVATAPVSNAPTTSTSSQMEQKQLTSLTDEQMEQIWENTPIQYKLASKTMSDEQIKSFIQQKLPNADADTLLRAIRVIRAK